MIDRVDGEYRTFKTRLLFIEDVFTNRYEALLTMMSGIQFKLNSSFEQYLLDLNQSTTRILNEDALKMLKKLNK